MMSIESHVEIYKRIGANYKNLFNAAEPLPKPPADIIGRDAEEIRRGLRNPEKANIVLLGEPGSGKTAAVQDFAYSDGSDESYLTLEVNPEKVIGKSEDRDSALLTGFRAIVDEAGEYSRDNDVIVVLFIDEFHKLAMFSPSLIEALKPILEKSALSNFRIIASTTFEEYNEWIASKNRALDQRLLRITLNELPREVVIKILQGRAERHDVAQLLEPGILESIYDESKRILLSDSQPRASIDILLSMIGETVKDEWMKDGVLHRTFYTPEELGIASEHSISRPLLKKIIKRTHSIDIDNNVNTHRIQKDLTSRLYNQDQAIETVMGYLEIAAVGFSDPQRPKFSFLSTGSTGVGKAITDNTPVPLYSEGVELYKRHGDLVEGDIIYSRIGQPTTVTGVYPQGEQDVYEIRFVDGSSIEGNIEHLWTYRRKGDSEWVTTTLGELMKKDVQAFEIPFNEAIEREPYSTKGCIDPYVLGSVFAKNEELVLSDDFPDRRIPTLYKGGSIEQRWSVIQGLFDSSGQINKDKGYQISYEEQSLDFILDIQEILASLGVRSSIEYTTTFIPNYRLVLEIASEDKPKVFSVGRSLALAKEAKRKGEGFVSGLGIESVKALDKKALMTCIMVDNDEHLYQVGKGHIVTHNTELAKIVSESMRIPLKRFDMSRYASEEDAGAFADDLFHAAWATPNAYILVDEVEKSSRQAMNILLQVLDDARLNDSTNPDRIASFTGNIINLTTNIGSGVYQEMKKHRDEDARVDTELIYKDLSESKVFETSVLGRIDAIVPFRPLPDTALERIAIESLRDIVDIGETAERRIIVSEDIIPYIVKDRTSSDTERGGARDVKRNIQDLVARKVAHQIANETREVPMFIYLEGEPRFKHPDVVDPMNAWVEVQGCHPNGHTEKLLKKISKKTGRPLVNEGLYLADNVPMNEHARDIVRVVQQGYYKLSTVIEGDQFIIKGID